MASWGMTIKKSSVKKNRKKGQKKGKIKIKNLENCQSLIRMASNVFVEGLALFTINKLAFKKRKKKLTKKCNKKGNKKKKKKRKKRKKKQTSVTWPALLAAPVVSSLGWPM